MVTGRFMIDREGEAGGELRAVGGNVGIVTENPRLRVVEAGGDHPEPEIQSFAGKQGGARRPVRLERRRIAIEDEPSGRCVRQLIAQRRHGFGRRAVDDQHHGCERIQPLQRPHDQGEGRGFQFAGVGGQDHHERRSGRQRIEPFRDGVGITGRQSMERADRAWLEEIAHARRSKAPSVSRSTTLRAWLARWGRAC